MSSPPRLLRWSRLFTVEVRHEYFANGICPGLVLRETPETSRAMVNLGLVRRDIAGGIAVFSDGSAPQDGFDLDFLLETTDPAFHSYTEIEGLAGAAALAFDSSRCAVPQPDGTRRLHIAPEASAADCMEPGAAGPGFKPGVPPVALVRIRATPPAEAASLLSGTRHVIAFGARAGTGSTSCSVRTPRTRRRPSRTPTRKRNSSRPCRRCWRAIALPSRCAPRLPSHCGRGPRNASS